MSFALAPFQVCYGAGGRLCRLTSGTYACHDAPRGVTWGGVWCVAWAGRVSCVVCGGVRQLTCGVWCPNHVIHAVERVLPILEKRNPLPSQPMSVAVFFWFFFVFCFFFAAVPWRRGAGVYPMPRALRPCLQAISSST